MLRHRGHECWTAGSVGLARAKDDELTVWAAEHEAVIISTDGEIGQRRMQNAIGRYVWLRCSDWEASEVLADHLHGVLTLLQARSDLTVRVSKESLSDSSKPNLRCCCASTRALACGFIGLLARSSGYIA
jgi:predicted nuclease of predicted toxin-antitoxin system